jgi:hypothetical protein
MDVLPKRCGNLEENMNLTSIHRDFDHPKMVM